MGVHIRWVTSGKRGATTARPQRTSTRDHRRAHRVVADPEFGTDLDQSLAIGVQACRLLSERLSKRRLSRVEARTLGDLAHGAAVHIEASCEFSNWHPIGVPSEQIGTIRGTQTGLSLRRIFGHGAALISDPRGA